MTQQLLQRLRSALADVRRKPLVARAITGSVFSIGGGFATQGLKFLVSLVLTKLLLPEVYGLAALVTAFSVGLKMLSDIGIGPSVIQNPRGEEPSFLQTAWSLQVVRGAAIGVISVLLAWPLSSYFEDARLVRFVPAIGLQAALAGFNSTTLFLLQRRLLIGKKVLLDLGAYVVSVPVMIVWAKLSPTPWALVGGGLAETLFLMVASHCVAPRSEHRFAIDRTEARQMLRFGRWVFFSTAFTFLSMRVGPLVLAKAFPDKVSLGLYNTAWNWSSPLVETLRDLGQRILFPLFAGWAVASRDELRRSVMRTRLILGVATTLPLLGLALFGPWLMTLLLRPEYWSAGPMLRLLAAGSIAACSVATLEQSLLAVGDSFRYMLWQAGRFAITFGCSLYGIHVGGEHGFVVGMAWSNLAVVPLLLLLVRTHGLLTPLLDVVFVAISAAALLLLP
jgi:O-antigen/teichoic acid export membrane protein